MIAREKMAWVTPEGSPSFTTCMASLLSTRSIDQFSSKCSFMLSSLNRQSTAEMPCAIIVASATPGTPILKRTTKRMSNAMFNTVETSRKMRAEKESPRPRSTPAKIL